MHWIVFTLILRGRFRRGFFRTRKIHRCTKKISSWTFLGVFSEFPRFPHSHEIESARVSSTSQFSLVFVDEESLVSVRDTQK